MKIGICDDEKEIRELLGSKAQKLYPTAEIFFYASGEELLAGTIPDILLLDIQMQGKGGMETARELRKSNNKVIIIFVTVVKEYVFEAFDVEAFHYIVKPFTDEKFKSVIDRAVRQWQDSARHKEKENRVFMVMVKGIHVKISIEDIVYAEVFNRKIIIHKMHEDIEYYGRMKELEKAAGEDFFRPHRAYLINFKYVEKYDASTIYLEKGTALMAKQKFPEFVKRYLKYNQRKEK